MGEVHLAALVCAFLAGSEDETRKYFDINGLPRYVRVDCETERHVIEVGLDGKSSARDSLHQALFAAHLTGKAPVVLLIDRDGIEGRYEYELRQTTRAVGVTYLTCHEDVVLRWAATAGLRARAPGRDDLPEAGTARSLCDLGALRGAEG